MANDTAIGAEFKHDHARHAANTILGLLRDHIPNSAMRKAGDELYEAFCKNNVRLLEVPTEISEAEYWHSRMIHLTARPTLITVPSDGK